MEGQRSNPGAGWTPGSQGEGTRGSALWGKRTGGFIRVALLALAISLLAPMAALADSGSGRARAYVDAAVLSYAQQNPTATQSVIISAAKGKAATDLAKLVKDTTANAKVGKLKRQFSVIDGVSAQLTGQQILALADDSKVMSIVADVPVAKAGLITSTTSTLTTTVSTTTSTVSSVLSGLNGASTWEGDAGIAGLRSQVTAAPTIAVVDSGVDAAACGCKLLGQINLYTGTGPNSATDGRGHGTMVAAIAAANKGLVTGAAPTANVVSLDVLDDSGSGTESDAIAAADWILQNKNQYNIKVANFSLAAGQGTSIQYDALDKAVERLWLAGVTVVAAAGNYGTGSTPSGVVSAPGNDPFVITVGAADTNLTTSPSDDFTAPWSAWGYTPDGFAKPELGAPGRQMVAGVPASATFMQDFASRVVSPGYVWMSGTSFAAPIVAGAAADILALHPTWTPDQVKGALMVSAKPYSASAPARSLGVGIVNGAAAAAFTNPPTANKALRQFVSTDTSTGATTFDVASWALSAKANATWASASWAEASWAEASWAEASWAEASWAESSFAAASWAENTQAEASWAENVTNANASWYE